MRKALVMAVALPWCLAAAGAIACGDKFLVIGRGVRSQRAKGAVRRASILLYVDARTELGAAIRAAKLETDLELAGHRIRSADSPAGLEAALRGGEYDIVLAGISDMAALDARMRGAASPPALLPVLYNPTEDEMAAAQRQYRCVMHSPGKKQHFLAVINDAMVLRSKDAHKAER